MSATVGTGRALYNFFSTQVGWTACAVGAAKGVPLAGAVVVGAGLAVHIRSSGRRRREAAFILCVAGLGVALDSLAIREGVFRPGMAAGAGALGYAITSFAIWANFASTIGGSLAWLSARRSLAAALGAAGGPIAYAAGAKLGALSLPSPPWGSLGALAIGWALVMPGLFLLHSRFHGSHRRVS